MEIGGGTLGLVGLITWVIAALGGFSMLGSLLRGGALRAEGGQPTRLPRPVLLGHFLLAVAGLVIWIIYLVIDADVLAWIAFILLLIVAALGLTMFARWLGGRRAATGSDAAGSAATGSAATGSAATGSDATVESRFRLPIVLGHGLFAVATLVLVILVALEVGGS